MMRFLVLQFCVLVIGTALVGCQKRESPVAEITIGVSLSSGDGEFRRQLTEGIVTRAKQHGYNILLTMAEGDMRRQRSDLEDCIHRKVDAILIEPVDPDSSGGILLRARMAGIPLFTIYGRTGDATVVSDVRCDESKAAGEAAAYLGDRLGKSRVIIILGDTLAATSRERMTGFRSVLDSAYTLDYIVPDGSDEIVIRVLGVVMGEHHDTLGIYALDEHATRLAATAVMRTGRRKAIVLGWDDSRWAVDAILREDGLTAVVNRAPGRMGGEAVEIIRTYLARQPVRSRVLVDARIIDRPSLMKRVMR